MAPLHPPDNFPQVLRGLNTRLDSDCTVRSRSPSPPPVIFTPCWPCCPYPICSILNLPPPEVTRTAVFIIALLLPSLCPPPFLTSIFLSLIPNGDVVALALAWAFPPLFFLIICFFPLLPYPFSGGGVCLVTSPPPLFLQFDVSCIGFRAFGKFPHPQNASGFVGNFLCGFVLSFLVPLPQSTSFFF